MDVYQPPVLDANPASPTYNQMVAPHWHYTYDQSGNELTQTDPNRNVTRFTYDERGNKLTHALPGGQSESWTYDQFNRVVTHTDMDGNTAWEIYANTPQLGGQVGTDGSRLIAVSWGAQNRPLRGAVNLRFEDSKLYFLPVAEGDILPRVDMNNLRAFLLATLLLTVASGCGKGGPSTSASGGPSADRAATSAMGEKSVIEESGDGLWRKAQYQIPDASPQRFVWDAAQGWRPSPTDSAVSPAVDHQIMSHHTEVLFHLDKVKLDGLLSKLNGSEHSGSGEASVDLSLPYQTADSSFARFRIKKVAAPSLGAASTSLVRFAGDATEVPGAVCRIESSFDGLHAMVLSQGQTTFIDPKKSGSSDYVATGSVPRSLGQTWSCTVAAPQTQPASRPTSSDAAPGSSLDSARPVPSPASISPPKQISFGGFNRIYRIAVAATPEYTSKAGGVDRALGAIAVTIDRVSAVYEAEFGIRLELVPNERLLIYSNPVTSPYKDESPAGLLDENQANLDATIGPDGYDIGQVFGVSGGGYAEVGCVGKNGHKGRGETGFGNFIGDGFSIDYVAHEIGHQFGGNHTFNGTTGGCGSANGSPTRNPGTAYEPGSGTTILGYAGVCETDDLGMHSGSYFHASSLCEIGDFVTGTVDPIMKIAVSSGRQPPRVAAGAEQWIPLGTPFVLTATGDPARQDLTYCWEEFDLGSPAPPDSDSDGKMRPLFRSFPPEITPIRTIPRLPDYLSDTFKTGETLPTHSCVLHFRVTARDNHGCFSCDTTTVNVSGSSGPFSVALPSDTSKWVAGSQQTVVWNVASTDKDSAIHCAAVDISLSADGGITFKSVASGVPNTGRYTVAVPSDIPPTPFGRIKVAAAGSIFFAISPNFELDPHN